MDDEENEEEEYVFEMTARMPGKGPATVRFHTKDYAHYMRVIKGVESALMREESAGLGDPNIHVGRKAHINKLAKKLALQMIKDKGFQVSLFDE